MEILLLSGGTPYANFKELAYAWGREKGFHHVLANSVCERRGEVERKKRSDAGRSMTEEEKLAFRSKLQKSRDKNGTSKKSKKGGEEEEEAQEDDTLNKVPEQGTEHQHHPVAAEERQAAEQIIAVDGGPMVEQTVATSQEPIEAAGAVMSEMARAVEAPVTVHVAPAESAVPAAEEHLPEEATGAVLHI